MNKESKKKRYEPLKHLGAGAFATVYLAQDKKLNREVAIKVFKKTNNPEQLARFEREALICKDLRHPHIIKIYDASITSQKPNIVMEYIEAGDLLSLIERKELSLDDAILIAEQIGDALRYLHSLNILHRDIKPANIMVEQPLRAILMDFNLAFSNDFTILTKEGYTVGTPRFMAPELLMGSPPSESSDIYSLGLVFHDMLTHGAISRETCDVAALSERVIKPPSTFSSSIPDEVDSLIMWMVSKNPTRRCQSAADFLNELERVQKALASSRPAIRIKRSTEKSSSGDFRFFPVLKAIAVLLIGVFILYSGRNYVRDTPPAHSSSENDSLHSSPKELLSHETSYDELKKRALKCNIKLHTFSRLRAFQTMEEKLFALSEKNGTNFSHCMKLKEILTNMSPGISFRTYVEYTYRLRQSNTKDSNDVHTIERLLDKAIKLYSRGLSQKGNGTKEELFCLQSMFIELWQSEKKSSQIAQSARNDLETTFFSLNEASRISAPGKALFHTIALSQASIAKNLHPMTWKILLLKAPYENRGLRSFQQKISKTLPQERLSNSTSDFESTLTRFFSMLTQFVDTSLQIKFNLHYEAKGISNLEYLGGPSGKENVAKKFDNLTNHYYTNLILGWYLKNLGKDDLRWTRPVMACARNCIQYDTFRFEFLYLQRPMKKREEGKPGTLSYIRTILPIWIDSARTLSKSRKFRDKGRIVSDLNNIITETMPFSDETLNQHITSFIHEVGTISTQTGAVLTTLAAIKTGNEPMKSNEIEREIHNLIEEATNLNDEDFKGWCIFTSIISNELLMRMKTSKENDKRLNLSVKILKRLCEYYPGEAFTEIGKITGHYAGPESLRQSTMIHACDAALETGGNFLNDFGKIARKLRVKKTLTFLSSRVKLGHIRGGSLASTKLLRGQILKEDDILTNPLSYR